MYTVLYCHTFNDSGNMYIYLYRPTVSSRSTYLHVYYMYCCMHEADIQLRVEAISKLGPEKQTLD